jgi:hypothetical protein
MHDTACVLRICLLIHIMRKVFQLHNLKIEVWYKCQFYYTLYTSTYLPHSFAVYTSEYYTVLWGPLQIDLMRWHPENTSQNLGFSIITIIIFVFCISVNYVPAVQRFDG